MPVAIYNEMKPFTNNVFTLNKGDIMYLVSDGFEDQFEGSKNRKFMAKQLKELFVNIAKKTMNDQRELLNSAFEKWRGECEQIDDVTILGIKI